MTTSTMRHWSTPAVIAGGTFMAGSGLLMFFGIHEPVKLAHEWMGLAFVVLVGFHAATHWRSLKSYFSRRAALAIIGGIAILAFGLMLVSPERGGGRDRQHGGRHIGQWEPGSEATVAALRLGAPSADAIRAILDEEASRTGDARHLAYRQVLVIVSEVQRGPDAALIQQPRDLQSHQPSVAAPSDPADVRF